MRARSAQLSLFAVCFLVGALLVVQLIAQGRGTEVTRLSAQELSTLIETLRRSNADDRAALLALRDEARDYAQAEAQGQSLFDVTLADLERVTAFAGLAAVRGQGIVAEVDGALDAVALNDLINELRNAGAEAIAVEGVRITSHSVAVQGAASLEIDGVGIPTPFTIRAIGDPQGLLTALERPGGLVAQLGQFIRATIRAEAAERLLLPATRRELAPLVGEPAG